MRIACLLLAVHAASAPSLEAQKKTRQEWWAEVIDHESAELGIKTLRTSTPAKGRVIRAWIGFGLFNPEYVTTITQQGGKVTGSKLLYWSLESDSAGEAEAERDTSLTSTRELGDEIKGQFGCERIHKLETRYFCEAALAPGQSWPRLLAALDSLGVETLPDSDSLTPPPPSGFDGVTLLVEIRRGAKYRMYRYWSPDPNSRHDEVRRANAIMDVLGTIGFRKK